MKHLRLAVNNIKSALYYCHTGARQTTEKLVHFYMLITLKHKSVVEKFVKNAFMVKNTHLLNGHMLLVHIGIASLRQFQCVPTTCVTEIKETYFEIYIYQESYPLALPL